MLLRFSIKNFLSFKSENSISLVANTIKELPENIFEHYQNTNQIRVLKSLCLYGKNSSGKSNIIKAFSAMKSLVLLSSKDQEGKEISKIIPFRLSEEADKMPSQFEVLFVVGDTKYRYGFIANGISIEQEWLFFSQKSKEEELFVRNNQEFGFSKLLLKGDGRIKFDIFKTATRENALFISVLSQFNDEIGIRVTQWFNSCQIILDANAEQIINHTAKLIHSNPDIKRSINRILEKSDLGFNSVKTAIKEGVDKRYDTISLINSLLSENLLVKTQHKKFSRSNSVSNIEFDLLENESMGTQKYFGLLGYIVESIQNSTVLFIDELDSRLHSLLLQNIITLFNSISSNPISAQLICSLHDTLPLNEKIIRRDQLVLVDKNERGESFVNNLNDLFPNVRNDASLQKDYLSGKYGGIPKLKPPTLFDDITE
jgi:uncharacterized protein